MQERRFDAASPGGGPTCYGRRPSKLSQIEILAPETTVETKMTLGIEDRLTSVLCFFFGMLIAGLAEKVQKYVIISKRFFEGVLRIGCHKGSDYLWFIELIWVVLRRGAPRQTPR